MNLTRSRIIQVVSVFIVQAITLLILPFVVSGFTYDSFRSVLVLTLVLSIVQSLFWWVFINLFSWMPVWLFPILTFLLNGALYYRIGDLVPGIEIANRSTGLWMAIWLTVVNAILAGFLSLDEDSRFDRNVIGKMVKRRGAITETDVPGFLFLEIDGLSQKVLQRAIAEGHMPTLKRWIDSGKHKLIGWETDFTSQTGAMQSGILMGNNTDIPAYRWWDKKLGKTIMSGKPKDAQALEALHSSGKGLCSDGGSSRGNMFSGDASESMLTFSTLLDKRDRGPGFYTFLFSPYVVFHILTRFVIDVIKEWWQAFFQRRRKDKYIVSARNFAYAFLRGGLGPVLHDLVTFMVISDALRGIPASYALFSAYDDLGHFAGTETPEAFEVLSETDHYFSRIEHALEDAPRPYHIVVLADHGQSIGPTFKAAYGMTLEELVKKFLSGEVNLFASADENEAWDNINSILTESTKANSRTATLLKRAFTKKDVEGMVAIGPERDPKELSKEKEESANVVVYGSGSSGLIYFTDSKERLTFEQLRDNHPGLVMGLAQHPGVGFVLVKSAEQGSMVFGKKGIHFLDHNKVEGEDPLADFGPNAALHLRRESSFWNCPDIIVNSAYDPQTQELAGFENQVGHHGGMGGPQNHPFILFPAELSYDGTPVVGAESVYKLLRSWREKVQSL
jgi:putative membrane protein